MFFIFSDYISISNLHMWNHQSSMEIGPRAKIWCLFFDKFIVINVITNYNLPQRALQSEGCSILRPLLSP